MRTRVVQIAATTDTDGDPVLYALCEDGSIWVKTHGSAWEEIDLP